MSVFNLPRTLSKLSSQTYKVLSSAKLHIEDSVIEKIKSLMKILNKIGPKTEP